MSLQFSTGPSELFEFPEIIQSVRGFHCKGHEDNWTWTDQRVERRGNSVVCLLQRRNRELKRGDERVSVL